MSLFVGNISRQIGASEFESQFDRIGPCSVNFKGSFAFVEFKDERDAEEAINQLNKKDIGGQQIAVEWSRKSGRFDAKTSNSRSAQMGGDTFRSKTSGCYNCGKPGHFARECRAPRRGPGGSPQRGGRSRSRSREYGGGYRGGPPRGGRGHSPSSPRGGGGGGGYYKRGGDRSRSRSGGRGGGDYERRGGRGRSGSR